MLINKVVRCLVIILHINQFNASQFKWLELTIQMMCLKTIGMVISFSAITFFFFLILKLIVTIK